MLSVFKYFLWPYQLKNLSAPRAHLQAMASEITSLTIVYSTVYSGADQIKHQSSASLAFVLGIHRWPVNCPHKVPVTQKMFPFDDVIMSMLIYCQHEPREQAWVTWGVRWKLFLHRNLNIFGKMVAVFTMCQTYGDPCRTLWCVIVNKL